MDLALGYFLNAKNNQKSTYSLYDFKEEWLFGIKKDVETLTRKLTNFKILSNLFLYLTFYSWSQLRKHGQNLLGLNAKRQYFTSLPNHNTAGSSLVWVQWVQLYPLILRKSDFWPLIFVQKCLLSLAFWGSMKICTHSSEILTMALIHMYVNS